MAAGLHSESLDGWFLFPTRAEISRFSTVSTPAVRSNQPRVSSFPLCPHRLCGPTILLSVLLHCVHTGCAVQPASCQFVSTVSTPALRSIQPRVSFPLCPTGCAVQPASCRFVFTVSTPALWCNQPRVSSFPLCPHRHSSPTSLLSVLLHCVHTGTAVQPASCQFVSTVSTPALRSNQPRVSSPLCPHRHCGATSLVSAECGVFVFLLWR